MASNTNILQALSEERRAALGPQFGAGSPIGGDPAPEGKIVTSEVDVEHIDDELPPVIPVEPVVVEEPVVESSTKGESTPTRRTTSGTKAGPAKA